MYLYKMNIFHIFLLIYEISLVPKFLKTNQQVPQILISSSIFINLLGTTLSTPSTPGPRCSPALLIHRSPTETQYRTIWQEEVRTYMKRNMVALSIDHFLPTLKKESNKKRKKETHRSTNQLNSIPISREQHYLEIPYF